MKTIFALGAPGRGLSLLPPCDVPEVTLSRTRSTPPRLPHVSENELMRHYTALSNRVHGMNDGFYPLGSCTMKYNPKVDEEIAALPAFTQLHPLQPVQDAQGALEVFCRAERLLCSITGMDRMTFQPAARRIYGSAADQGLPPASRRHGAHGDHRARLCPRHQSRLGGHGGLPRG